MTRRPRPRARVVVAATLAAFLAVLALLVFQLRSGRDPALGKVITAAKAPVLPPKRILVRKTIITRVIVHLPAEEEDVPLPVTVAPTVTSSAPAPPAPATAPAPAAASAPPPAPLTTHSS